MKEFYLVPKHLYDAMKSTTTVKKKGSDIIKGRIPNSSTTNIKRRIPKIGEQWQTKIPPPPLRNQITLNSIKGTDTNDKPNIYTHLSLRMSGKELQRATLILKHFDKSNDMKWDEYGDLYSPINGYNIIDIIHDLIYHEKISNIDKLNDFKYIITSSALPIHYIKNKFIKEHLSEQVNIKTGGSIPKKKAKVCTWTCY